MMQFSPDPYVAEQQIKAVIFSLVAFAYIDSEFALAEKQFIRDYLAKLADQRATGVLGDDGIPRDDIVDRWTAHYHEILDEHDAVIRGHFTESVAVGETSEQFVLSRLKLGCFELLSHFDDQGQQEILSTVTELMHADGVVAPEEQAFVDEIIDLIHKPIELDEADIVAIDEGPLIIDEARTLEPRTANHPFLNQFEWDFARDPATFAQQSAQDMALVDRVMGILDQKRQEGIGKLAAAGSFAAFTEGPPILDGHVWVAPTTPDKNYELIVVGDLHGCYSCLKAALMQSDFFAKVDAHRQDPQNHPATSLVLLGDYIDRGKFSYSGTLRSVLQLYAAMPDNVFMLRGNHEFYIELKGRVVAPVRPCEAMDSIAQLADNEMFVKYMNLFEALPNCLVCDSMFFVHGGIPRSDTMAEKWRGIQSLNDREMRFQMLWSDPSDVDVVPTDLQKQSARFPFGRKQFQQFMSKVGCRMMVRGHERVTSGFSKIYNDPEGVLVSLFSAGGEHNDDLPKRSNYRQVTPMALSIRYQQGATTLSPFLLDYGRYNQPEYNAFFKDKLAT